jgi:hypothetical protein
MVKYGGRGPMVDDGVKRKANKTKLLNQREKILKYIKEIGFILLTDYKHAHELAIFKHIECSYEWKTKWNNFWNKSQNGNPCPNCKPKQPNKKIAQSNIQRFIESLGIVPLVDNRVFLGDRREIDFIIEEEKVCIEYCGLYWHSDEILGESRKLENPKTYHLSKLEICENKGYKLITIFEDEWIQKKEITQARIKQILNRNTSTRIHTRKCNIIQIDSHVKNSFLSQFHIQGKVDNSTLFYSAIDENGNLIALMTFGSPRGIKKPKSTEWELKRFCTNYNYHAPGIANKILNHFKNNNEWEYIISYADRRWSNGELYYKLGFTLEGISGPAVWYINPNKIQRHHRSIMWKTDEEKKSGLTQSQLAVIKGFRTIHDCGNLKFILTN